MTEKRDDGAEPEALSRRDFAHYAVKAGLAAGAATWIAPHLSSYALAQTVGSAPPSAASGDERRAGELVDGESGAANGDPPSGAAGADPSGTAAGEASSAAPDDPSTPGNGAPGDGASRSGGQLALTGNDARALAAAGGAAVLTGSALVAAQRLKSRHDPRPAPSGEGPSDETAR